MSRRQARLRLTAFALLALSVVLGAWWAMAREPQEALDAASAPEAAPVVDAQGARESLADSTSTLRAEESPETLAVEPSAVTASTAPTPEPAFDGLHGTVRDELGQPIAGARVRVSARRGASDAELQVAETDAQGRYRVAVKNWTSRAELLRAVRAAAQRSDYEGGTNFQAGRQVVDAETWVRSQRDRSTRKPPVLRSTGAPIRVSISASAAGFTTESSELEIDRLVRDSVELDFTLRFGSAVYGTVVLASPTPEIVLGARGAQVFLIENGTEIRMRTRSLSAGQYQLLVPDFGTFDVFARHPQFGTAFLQRLPIDIAASRALPDLVLAGPHRMRGIVVYPDGKAVRCLGLEARHVAIAARVSSGLTELDRIQVERDKGLAIANAFTGMSGTFEIPGLQPGEFELTYPGDPEATGASPARAASDAEGLQLVYRGYRLHIWVQQSNASPADKPEIECSRLALDPSGATVEHLQGVWDDSGHWFTTVSAGERYLVRAWASNSQTDWTVVDIPPASYETYASLALFGNFEKPTSSAEEDARREEFGGRLALSVLDGKGGKVSRYSVRAVATDDTIPRGWMHAAPDEKGMLPVLPPGAYRLHVRSDDPTSFTVFEQSDEAVEVRRGSTTRHTVRGVLGGRLHIGVRLDITGEAISTESVPVVRDARWLGITLVTVEGDEPGAHEISLTPRIEAGKQRGRGDPRGVTEWDPALAPGRYVVRISSSMLGQRVAVIDVEAGALADIVFTESVRDDD